LQRGKGVGGIFASLFRFLKPIIPKIFSAGKKALKDPAVAQALTSVKGEAVAAGKRAINKGLKKIAPDKPKQSKAPKLPKPPKPPNQKTSTAPKRLARSLQTTAVPPKKKNKNSGTIFDNMVK